MARNIHKRDIGDRCNGHKPDGKTVYAVGEIHGVGRADNNENGKRYIKEAKIKKPLLKEGDAEHRIVRVVRVYIKENADHKGDQYLCPEFIPGTQSAGISFYRFEIIIYK